MEIKNTLNKAKHKKSLNKDINIKFELNNNSSEILTPDYFKIINQYDVFDNERNVCQNYRLTVTPNIIASNVLAKTVTDIYDNNNNIITGDNRFNLLQTLNTGYTYHFGYDVFDNHFLRLNTFKTGATLTDYDVFTIADMESIQKSITHNLINDNGWLCFYNKTKINNKKMISWKQPNEKIDLFPTRDYFSLKPFVGANNTLNYNWDYIITYPHKTEKNHILVTNNSGVNGLPIFNGKTGFTVEIGNYLEIQTPYKHGLNEGDVIRLKGDIYQTGKTYQIYSTGNINGEHKSSVFLINIDKYSDLKDTTYVNNIKNRRVVKYTNGVESEYYIRVFKSLENVPSSDIYKLGFSKNIFSDDIYQIQYIEDINISGLTDNLERPLNELYLTFIKKNVTSDENGHNNVFGDLTSGINEIEGVTGYTNVRILSANNENEAHLEGNITISGTSLNKNLFYGDIVEFNKYEVKEYTLDDVMYRFNLNSREKENLFKCHDFAAEEGSSELLTTNTIVVKAKNEGYFYTPHYRISIKNISSIKKQGELGVLYPCNDEPFISGVTINNNTVLLSTHNSNDLKYLLLKVNNIADHNDYDRIRVSKLNLNNEIIENITFNIRVLSNVPSHIAIPYNSIFFGATNNLNNNTYLFNTYYSTDIPSNATSIDENKVFWRDVHPEGVFDENSVFNDEFPFTNNSLYLNRNLNLYIRRQDPFGGYGLRDKNFPSDVVGNKKLTYLTNNRYEKPNNIC